MTTMIDSRRSGASFAVTAAVIAVVLVSCGRGGPDLSRAADPSRIQAYSEGLLPSGSAVKVVLAASRGLRGDEAPAGSLRLEPAVAGAAFWEDENTLAFRPDRPLARGRSYVAALDLGLLDGTAEAGRDVFRFEVRVAEQRVVVETLPPRVGIDGSVVVEGSLVLADGVSDAAAEAALVSSSGSLSWSHGDERRHRFAVTGLAAGAARTISLRWNGASLGGGGSGRVKVKLPPEGFELLAARPVSADEGSEGVELAFSRPLDRAQDLRGLVSVAGVDDLRYSVSGSTVKLYASTWPASASVRVERGLKDAAGRLLAVPAVAKVAFDWEKPSVRFLTKGCILPTDQGLVVPIETMNLAAVTVEALRVYGDNMLQFLQVNDLESSRELKRVGEVVWSEKVRLDWQDDWKNRWVRQGLELGALLAEHSDGMFQIRITFRKDDIRYVCPESHDFDGLAFPPDRVVDRDDDEFSFWDYVESWANGYDDYYKYRDDPCHPAFYLPSYDHDITVRRNVIVSDIGATARREADGAWHVAVADLRTATPLAGANVALYSYQRRPLGLSATGPGGIAVLRPEGSPAFATVQYGSQTSWVKVDEGSSLSIGHFDVGGEKADSGLKGLIYGERGVWRPGDDIHLTFALYDRSGKLPAEYPISFELEDPLGRVVRSGTYTESVGGFYSIETGTAADAPTGAYVARVMAGGRTFAKALKVETVMPNRLKIGLDWGDSPYLSADSERVGLSASWLTGAKAGALKADVSATFSAASTAFPGYPEYSFDDPTREVSSDRAVLFDGRLGSDGSTSFDIDLGSSRDEPPGMLRANILTRVFEPSGVFSSESFSADFHPYERYLGIRTPNGDASRGMLLTDKDQRVDLVLVDRDGKLLRKGTEVEIAIYQIEWRWWWEKGEESLAQRASQIFRRPVKKDTIRIGSDGRGSWSFQIKYPNWGRFLVRAVDKSGGHAAAKVVYVDWPGWAGRGRDSGGAQAMLELTAGAEKYAPGDKASVSFPSNAEGRALVAVERAGKILREEWIRTRKETTLYEFPVTPEMAPNVYLHVSFVQPHLQTSNDLPIRLYGVVPIKVEDPATRLRPVIETADSLSPGGKATFTVREEKGRPMTYTVAVVDEGLLGITRFRAPDPWDEFYKKEASALPTWDLYQYVAGAYSGKLETLLAIGGSDEGVSGGDRKPSRFPAVVRFFPPRQLKAGEKATESFTLGPYIGALRFMVVAGAMPSPGSSRSGASGAAFGAAERSVPVKADVMAQLTAPRTLSPGEEASIPATVFAYLGRKRASVRLRATGALSLAGAAEKTLDFTEDGDLTTSFSIRAADAPGRGSLVLTASIDGRKSEQSVDIEVRSVGVPISSVTPLSLEGGKSWTGSVAMPGVPGTNSLELELSRLKPIDLAERVDWLLRYPHGCAEQITSAAFPQLYLPKAASLDPDQAERSKANVVSVIERLRGFQTARGGFSTWPGTGEEQGWISAYVAHFLLAAGREGFDVPSGLLDEALGYLSRAARAWNSSEGWSMSIQAYRLYDLALAGKPEIAAMNRFRDFPDMPVAARFRLAAAYALSGMREASSSLVRGLAAEASEYPGMAEKTYGSGTRDRAVILDALNALGDTARALPVYNKLAEELDSRRWMSTQELGAALGAALPYAVMAASGEAPEVSAASYVEGWSKSFSVDRAMARRELPAPPGSELSLTLENKGRTPVFARIVARGTPPPGDERSIANGISLSLRYVGMDGRAVDPAKVGQGEDFVVEATVRNRSGRDLSDLALSQLMPSGWEIANYRVGADLPKPSDEDERRRPTPRAEEKPLYDYQDRRDDRVLTYFSLGAKDAKVFTLYVTKAYEGSFFLPASSVECMYDERFSALVPGRWLSSSGKAPGAERRR